MEHGARYRRQQDSSCYPDGIQHILFVLDASGSVGEANFNMMTTTLSRLVTLFCSPIKIAVMSFDHEYFVEFCFNCFENTCAGRQSTASAIGNINYYHGDGTRYTHTGGAAQCVCDVILTPSCGLDLAANCIDVVFITDGRSNDPNRDVCTDILCLHNRFGVNTFAIGIGNADQSELECITEGDDGPGGFHLFDFDSFDDFQAQIECAINRLATGATNPDGDPYICIDPDGPTPGLGTDACNW